MSRIFFLTSEEKIVKSTFYWYTSTSEWRREWRYSYNQSSQRETDIFKLDDLLIIIILSPRNTCKTRYCLWKTFFSDELFFLRCNSNFDHKNLLNSPSFVLLVYSIHYCLTDSSWTLSIYIYGLIFPCHLLKSNQQTCTCI